MSVTIDNGVTFGDASEMNTNELSGPTTPIYQVGQVQSTAAQQAIRSATIPVGSYAMLKSIGSQPVLTAALPISPGFEVDGLLAQLHPSDRLASAEAYLERYVHGTWRCMGYIAGTTDRVCIWLKVAM